MKNKTALFGVDIQNDFTSLDGSLYIEGAHSDSVRTAAFIDKYRASINYIALTLDTHKPIHIGSQQYWIDKEGYPPALYSIIMAKDVAEGNWIPKYHVDKALPYLQKLENAGGVNTIWPLHCLYGSSGWAVNSMVMQSIYAWSVRKNRSYDLYYKGMEEYVEQYSVFSVLEGFETKQETICRDQLLNKLSEFGRIVVLGQAADFCLINSLTDLLEMRPDLAKKIVVITDCMSWINPHNERATYLFESARSKGVRFVTSENYNTLEIL